MPNDNADRPVQVKRLREQMLRNLNLTLGDHYEVTVAGRVINFHLADVIWDGTSLVALRGEVMLHVPHLDTQAVAGREDASVDSTMVTVIPWESVESVVWHEHQQERYDTR